MVIMIQAFSMEEILVIYLNQLRKVKKDSGNQKNSLNLYQHTKPLT